MTGPLYHLGRFCARHWRPVVAVWIVAAVGLAIMGRAAGHKTSDDLTLPGTGSTKATDVLEERLPNQAYGSNPFVLESHHGKLTDSKNKQAVDDTVKDVRNTPHVVKAVNPLSDEGSAFLSKDKTIAYIPVTLDVSQSDITKDEAQQVLDAGDPARDAGLDVSLGGYAGQQLSKPDTHQSEAIGLAAAVVILLLAFGSVIAGGMPMRCSARMIALNVPFSDQQLAEQISSDGEDIGAQIKLTWQVHSVSCATSRSSSRR